MYYNLFLDDIRNPVDVKWVNLPLVNWIIVRSYDEFTKYINANGLPNFISLDHDLGIESMKAYNEFCNNYDNGQFDKTYPQYDKLNEKTGYDCAKFLINYCIDKNLDLPEYCVHSINIIGKQNIISLLESYKKSRL